MHKDFLTRPRKQTNTLAVKIEFSNRPTTCRRLFFGSSKPKCHQKKAMSLHSPKH